MGNQAAKGNGNTLLQAEENVFVQNSFKVLSANSEKLKSDVLVKAWTPLIDKELITYIKNSCFGVSNAEQRAITMKPYMEHFYVAVKGSLDEKSNFINTKVFGNPPGMEGAITAENLLKFVSAVVRSYFIMLDNNKTEQYKSWIVCELDVLVHVKDIDNYSEFLLKDLINEEPISLDDLENWLHRNPLWLQMWKAVVVYIYSYKQTPATIPHSISTQPDTLPFCELPPNCSRFTSILDVGKIMFISDQLPTSLQKKWRLLFSSQIHGESFSTFLGKLMNQGPTLLIVEDDCKHIFGGFAPGSWSLSPKFVGDDTATLFTLEPKMQSFIPSGYNDHYQYLNLNQQTMPNGLGMGGQFDYWGLWLDHDYGRGHSAESCTTFKNFKQLSGKKEFIIRNLEVWAVGELPKPEEGDLQQGSVLDTNLEEKVMLELAGREIYSEGLRDPDLDL